VKITKTDCLILIICLIKISNAKKKLFLEYVFITVLSRSSVVEENPEHEEIALKLTSELINLIEEKAQVQHYVDS
jgi:hypothetical protein